MHCLITDTTSYALAVLQSNTAGIVHSVYRKTINLLFEEQLLALQSVGSPLSPLSLITDQTEVQMQSLPICAGQKVTADAAAHCITIHTPEMPLHFSCQAVRPHDPTLQGILTEEQQATLQTAIQTVLLQSGQGGFSLIFQNNPSLDDTLILATAKRYIAQARQEFRIKKYGDAASSLCHLIGLGIGLTPSGDDFLCGVLAGLCLLNRDSERFSQLLHQQVSCHLKRTNDISAAFLDCALHGRFSQAVCSLPTVPTSSKIARLFSAIGHSSGMDTLCGIDFVFQLYARQV